MQGNLGPPMSSNLGRPVSGGSGVAHEEVVLGVACA